MKFLNSKLSHIRSEKIYINFCIDWNEHASIFKRNEDHP